MTNYRLVDTATVAAELEVSPRTVARYVEAGELRAAAKAPGLRGAYLFDPSEIEALKESRTS